ncbi:MAG: hypothetical protein FJY26_11315 [Betaproteobacteria bacterium]|nr:hypothetical protein [Betaproteobacteria bacterium]
MEAANRGQSSPGGWRGGPNGHCYHDLAAADAPSCWASALSSGRWALRGRLKILCQRWLGCKPAKRSLLSGRSGCERCSSPPRSDPATCRDCAAAVQPPAVCSALISFTLSEYDDTTIQNRLPGVLESIGPDVHPSQALVRVRCGLALILGRVTHRAVQQLGLAPGFALWCQVKSAAVIL